MTIIKAAFNETLTVHLQFPTDWLFAPPSLIRTCWTTTMCQWNEMRHLWPHPASKELGARVRLSPNGRTVFSSTNNRNHRPDVTADVFLPRLRHGERFSRFCFQNNALFIDRCASSLGFLSSTWLPFPPVPMVDYAELSHATNNSNYFEHFKPFSRSVAFFVM